MWFEDIPLGNKITLGSYAFTEENIIAFAKKYDPQPFHIDKDAAARSPYGGLIASGWHTSFVLMKLVIAYCRGRGSQGEESTPGDLVSPRGGENPRAEPGAPRVVVTFTNDTL